MNSKYNFLLKPHKIKRKSFIAKLRDYLIAGIVFASPLLLTVAILVWLIKTIDVLFANIIVLFPSSYIPKYLYLPGIGVIVALVFLIVVGIVGTNFLGKYIIIFSDKLLNKVPVVKFIYGTIKQMLDTFVSGKDGGFKSVVLIEFPQANMWTLGFITAKVESDFRTKFTTIDNSEEMVSVFVPTSPSPTAGFLLFVSKSKTIDINISVNEAVKIVISGGIISPSNFNKTL